MDLVELNKIPNNYKEMLRSPLPRTFVIIIYTFHGILAQSPSSQVYPVGQAEQAAPLW